MKGIYNVYPKFIRIPFGARSYTANVYKDKVVFDDQRIPTLLCSEPKRSEIISHIHYYIELRQNEKRTKQD